MPMPTEERVSELVATLIEARGYDLEDVQLASAGPRTTVRVIVDGEDGVSLDAIADLSRALSARLDEAYQFGESSYTLEVTTPGIGRPLTAARHWRRARGHKVRVRVGGETFDGRIGRVADGAVDLVVSGTRGPDVRTVPLADISEAVVQVEFSAPAARELELAGGARRRPSGDHRTGAQR